ncbi:hypothetical protein [Reyranella sp.]|uniref:hypothetical protein n=1 Tax=Reyranella sp. TaxID=1929291 RepID=UPI003D0DEF17
MTDSYDDFESPEEALEALAREMRTTGAREAYQTLLSVCRDPKAPAPAKATAGVALLRAAGLMAANEKQPGKKELHEMTREELTAHRQRLEAISAALAVEVEAEVVETPPAGVFE